MAARPRALAGRTIRALSYPCMAPRPSPDPVIEAYKKDVDRTLIRENLARSVEERFERLMALQLFAEELRRAACRFASTPTRSGTGSTSR